MTDMNWIEILLFIILFIGEIASIYAFSVLKKFGENKADIIQNRFKEYEAEKGRNLATKEDVEDVTKKVEEVKSVVTFSNQRRFDQLADQERILLELLYDATKIAQSQNKLILYFYDTSSRTRYDNLVESVNDILTHFYHLSNLAIVSIQIACIADKIRALSVATSYLASQVNVAATNAASLVDQFKNQMEYAMKMDNSDSAKAVWMSNAIQTKKEIVEMQGKPIEGRDQLNIEIEDYCKWLKQLYGKDFFVFNQEGC